MPTQDKSDLSIRGLRVFVAVEETGSVGKAAERIGGSPSGVSQQISALERSIGASLFDRKGRPMTLTPAGQILKAHAHSILSAVDDARAELSELSLATLPKLSLAIIDDLDASLTPVLVSGLQQRFRDCFVTTLSGRSDLVTRKLERREADIAVSSVVPGDAGSFRAIPLLREPLVLVTAKGVIDSDEDTRARLAALPFVQYSETMPIGRLVTQHLNRVRFSVPRRFAFESSRSVFAMVVKSRGWTLTTPLNLLDAERFVAEVDILPMPFPALSRTVYLIARTDALGRLPEQLAGECRVLLADHAVERFPNLAPLVTEKIEILEE